MHEGDRRSYIVSGELSNRDWSAVRHVLGMWGLDVTLAAEGTGQVPAPEAATTMPHSLTDITSGDMYVSNEHAEEFWLRYMQRPNQKKYSNISRNDAGIAFKHLVEPKPRRGYLSATPESSRSYAELLGLDIRARSEARFPESPYWGTIATAESLIAVVRQVSDLEETARPKGISRRNLQFLNAFADYLEEQIADPETPTADDNAEIPDNFRA